MVGRPSSLSLDTKPSNPKDCAATNRLDLSLFPDTAVAYGALAMTEGDAKYGGYNFRVDGVLASVYIAACRRHLAQWFNGEEADAHTGIHHLGSALAGIAILIDAIECKKLNDDRPPAAPMSDLLSEAEEYVEGLHAMYDDGPARFRAIPESPTQEEKPKP